MRHAITHGRHTTGDLNRGAELARRRLDLFRVVVERLMRRQHVVIRGDDAKIGHGIKRLLQLIGIRRCRHNMGIIGAAQLLAARFIRLVAVRPGHEGRACGARPLDDAVGNFGKDGVQFSHDA